jgi:hypothetical protein
MNGVKRTVACLEISSVELGSLVHMSLGMQIIIAVSMPVVILDSVKRSLRKLFLEFHP